MTSSVRPVRPVKYKYQNPSRKALTQITTGYYGKNKQRNAGTRAGLEVNKCKWTYSRKTCVNQDWIWFKVSVFKGTESGQNIEILVT